MDLTNPQITHRQARIEELEAELAKEREKVKELDTGLDQALRERDAAEDIGTRLAEVVGGYFRVEVGEHSNMNDPREMAIAILEGEYQTDSDADRKLAAAQATIEQMREALESKVSISELLMEAHEDSCRIHDDAMFCTCGAYDAIRINKAIAIPTNLDALHEARALECERLAEVFEPGWIKNMLDREAAAHRARKQTMKEEGK